MPTERFGYTFSEDDQYVSAILRPPGSRLLELPASEALQPDRFVFVFFLVSSTAVEEATGAAAAARNRSARPPPSGTTIAEKPLVSVPRVGPSPPRPTSRVGLEIPRSRPHGSSVRGDEFEGFEMAQAATEHRAVNWPEVLWRALPAGFLG